MMSGGHFNYAQYKILEIADQIEQLIVDEKSTELDEYGESKSRDYAPDVIEHFECAERILRAAYIYVQRIDWLVSGDDGEDAFRRRLVEELAALDEQV